MGNRIQLSPKSRLQILYEGVDEDYKELFDFIAKRKHQDAIDVEMISKVIPSASRSTAITVARKMEQIGVGKFVIGRRGSPTRLEWLFRSDSVGLVARGDLDELVSLGSNGEARENMMEEIATSAEYIVHSFRLRRDEDVRFQLPSDLTQQEAGRLSEFIKSLPFG